MIVRRCLSISAFAAAIIGMSIVFFNRDQIDQSPGCGQLGQSEVVPLSVPSLAWLHEWHRTAQMVFESRCFRVGKEYPTQIRYFMADGSWIYQTIGTIVRVKRIHLIDPQSPASRRTLTLVGAADEEEYRRFIRFYPKNALIQLLEIEYVRGPIGAADRGTQIESSVFKPMDWFGLTRDMIVVDVRSRSEFLKSHAENALNIEYAKESAGEISFFKLLESFAATDRFSTDQLPNNKDTPLVFVGTNLVDIRPFRALIRAYVAGWRNLYWLRDGEMGRLHLASETPPTPPDIATLQHAEDLIQLESKTRAKLISVEMDKIDPGYNSVFESINIPIDDLSMSFPVEKLPNDKETPLVFSGTDLYDQNALRSARLVKQAGWKNIYWYRGGRMDWESH